MWNNSRKISLLFILLFISMHIAGQNLKKWKKDAHYEAMIEMTSSLSFSPNTANVFAIETIHGIATESDGFFAGIGAGFYSKGYWPILSKTQNIGRENFNISYIHRYSLSLSAEVQYRMANIRKLKKVFKPFISFKFIYLVHKHRSDNINVYIDREDLNSSDLISLDYNNGGLELAVGGEFVIKHWPRMYFSLGYEFFDNSLEITSTPKNDEPEGPNYSFKFSAPKSLNLKIGVRL